MELTPLTLVSRNPEAIFAPVEGETVILEPVADRYVCLNATGTRLWQLLERPASVGELARLLTDTYGVEPPAALTDVTAFVRSLDDRGLIVLSAG
jgi:hypothetical protein